MRGVCKYVLYQVVYVTPTSPFIGRMNARKNRVAQWLGLFSLLINIWGLVILLDLSGTYPGIPTYLKAGGLIGAVTIISFIFVLVEERMGWWGNESRHIWTLAGWDPEKLDARIKKIMKKLEIEDETV